MIPLPMLFELYDYNYWASDRQLRQLGNEPPPVDFLVAHDLGFRP